MDIENEIDTVKLIIAKAKSHVQIYQIQRNLARNLISIAQLDITYHIPSLFCQKALTIDMGQTFSLTNFEGKQSGNTYYMSPLIVLLFWCSKQLNRRCPIQDECLHLERV